MKLEYLKTAEAGVRWFGSYYRRNPQINTRKAVAALRAAETSLLEFPMTGVKLEGFEVVREKNIAGTAFSLLYTVQFDTIFVIDLRDQRGHRSAEALGQFVRELRQRGPNSMAESLQED